MNTADPESAAKWLGKIPFFVHYQIYPNETSEGFADIVLPDTCQLEALDVLSSEMYHFHYPVGMQPMEYHVRQPVVKPMYERRDMREFLLELAERLGIQKEYYDQLNKPPIMTGCTPPLDREKTYTWEEVVNQYLVSKFGPDNDLEAVSKKGFVQWPKRVEEAYWRPYIKARSMIYMEFLIEHAEKLKAIISPRGIELDWRAYTPLISFFPAAPHKVEDSEFDLFAFSYRDVLFAGSHCQGLPWLRECAGMNPFSEMICMNKKTAQKKGMKEGDTIYLENTIGKKVEGKVHLIEGIHPQCVASVSHAGKWSNAQPIGKGKAPFFTALLQNDFEHWCPVTLNPEGSAKVKAIKAGDIK
jgi:molybdopterin-containing oxidoreductase family molybdopterin binding subunit